MFKTKLEVDKHVNNCLKKITNDTERNLRCFSFAKLYYNVGDYEHAYRYATSYLSVKSKSAEGHLLLGKSLEKLGKYEAALEAYRNSLQADPKQNNLVLKVCELLSSDNIDMDLSGARYFCELAQSIAPDNPSVFALKEKLICIEHENPTEVARLLLEELERRPTDVSLRTRLLRHFVRHNMITEAYKHASSIEDSAAHAPDSGQSRCDFFNNLMWYETFYEVLSKYRKARSSEINEAFWLKFVSVCERVADLSLQEYRLGEGTKTKGVPEYVQTVLNLDETLNEAYRFVNSTSSDRSATKVFFEQYRAQLYFHLATLVYKQAKRDILDFKEASNVVLPLLFVAYHTNPPESNNRLYKLACYRNSQTGHILLSLSKDGKSLLLEKAAQYSTGTWRENLYKKLFGRRDLTASFFLNQLLTEPVNKLPIIDDLLTYDTVALKLYPDSLHHYVWVMMNDNVPVNIRLVPFDGLLYSTANLSNCAAESLNYLDVYSFVCCATFCSTIGHSNRRLLPANITDNLVTVEQSKFMLGAYKMYQNDRSTDTGDLRMLLIKGIEVTRCIGQHGLDAKLLVSLGELLEERAKKLDKRSEVELTLDRAELYWSTGLSLLDRIVNEEAVVHSNNRLFAYKSDLTSQEARSMINKGKLFLAVRTFEKNRLEQALAMLKELKDPYASYHQYEIYKKMSDANANANTKTSLLTLARDSLYLTLDRLREQPYTYSHPLNLELGTKITEIEQQLDLTGVYDRELDLNMTGLSLSNDAYSTPARPSNKQASLREECRPSPERLDAQIRQLACSKDASFTIVSEQNRMVVDMQKCLLDKLNRVIDELKDIKGDVEALKERAKTEAGAAGVHADDIQNMMDVIQEIRKDLNEVKKNDSRNNQLSDEDLYVLDPDYGVDYNLSGNMAGTSMYGNFPTPRMPNPNHLAAYGQSLMYPGLYPGGLTYPYGGLNFVQPGPLPFLPDHQQPPLSTSAAAAAAPSNLLSQPIGLNQTKFLPTADVATSSRINQIAAPPALSLPAPASVATPTTTPSAPARPNPTTPLFGKGAPVNVVITTSDPLPNRSALTAQQPVLSVTIPPQHVKSNSGKAAAAATPSRGDGGTADGAESAADGEENEEVVFCKRAKLFNYVTVDGKKEWKERGTGELKVLRNKSTGKSRILMRRERTRKICANHFVRDDTHLVRPNNSDLSFIWLAHDYSDGTAAAAAAPPRPETFHVKFAAADEATAFYDAVESVKSSTGKSDTRPVDSTKTSAKDDAESATTSTTVSSTSKSSMGGFVFTGTPTFKPKELGSEAPTTAGVADVEPAGTKTGTPFVSFVFGKAVDEPKKTFAPLVIARENDGDGGDKEDKVEEFVPTAEFKPVVPLPDIVEVKTGEEGAEVLFEARTKLFRYVTNEWKERGLGCLKVLKDNDSIRLLMRRDQVHKICCNHRVLKDMPFKLKSDNPKAVMWSAQDFSEEELKLETFTARFRSEEIAAEFIRILSDNQLKLDENNSFGTTPQKIVPTASIAGNASATTGVIGTTTTATTTVVGQKAVPSFSEGFGDSFKPKPGSWECEVCLVRNDNSNGTCTACETPKEGGINASKSVLGTTKIDCKWSFGVPAQTVAAATPFGTTVPSESKTNDFGDRFKPASDTWECGTCLVRNDNSTRTCTACNTTKAGGTDAATADCKWTFGVPNQSGTTSTVANLFGQTPAKSEQSTEKFFGKQTSAVNNLFAQKAVPDTTSSPVVFTANVFGQKDATSTTPLFSSGGIFGQKDATSTTPVFSADGIFGQKAVPLFGEKTPTAGLFGQKAAPANLFGTAGTGSDSPKEGYVFGAEHKGGEFEFKQRTPRRVSGGESDGGNADDRVVEEEEVNIYFKPVVPLPDVVEVKTDEEDADALFVRRAKLYRFVDGEWKERGIGDVKLLRDRASRRLRVVMRREQVLKVCLNHALDRNVEYVPKDERSFVFGVADFSEGEMAKERLCLRFKNAEVAGEFKRAVDEAVGNCTASADASFRSTDDDDVIVVSETQVTPEEEKFAKSLGLPAKFLAYKQLPDCACAQCKKDDEYLKELFASDSKPAQSSTTTPGKSSFALKPPTLAQPKSTPETTPATAPPPKFSFSSPNMAAFGTTATTVIPFGSSGSNASSGSFGTPLSSTGNSLASPAPSAGSSLFGTPVSSTTSLFGTNSNRIFGNGAPPTGGSIFGGGTTYNSPNTTTAAATAVGSTTNLFGSNSTTSNSGLFGGTTFNSPSTTTAAATTVGSTTNLFGSNSTTSNSGIFGTTFNSPSTTTAAATTVGSTTNLFGSSSTTSNTGIFGGTAFNSPSTTTVGSTANLFGSSSTSSNTSIFGGTNFSFAPPSKPFQPATTTGTGLFGGVSKSSSTVATSDGADANEIVLKCDTNLSFSSLASNVKIDAKPSFTMKTVTDETFSFLGAGAPVFQSTAGKGTANGKDDEGDDEGGTNDDYDPHYEPIVPLPEQIVVTTGEEDEDALFNDRAKLFRYVADTKEWKERGVGQLKVLYHREKHTYRLLLRREQVHKLVLNQLVTKDLELKAMTTEKSWMWVGYNFVDDETNLEKLAVRFKKPETALEFRTVVERATEQLRLAETEEKKSHTNESDGEVPVTVSNFGEGHYEGYYEEANKYSEGEEDDDDVEEEEDDEKTIMFVKECTLSERLRDDGEWQEIGKGDLQVYYDPDVFGARIQVNDEYGKVMSVTLIGINTIMESEGNECTWKAREWTTDMQMRNLKATFADESAAQEFHSNYFEGLNYAQQVGLVDESPVQCASDDTDE